MTSPRLSRFIMPAPSPCYLFHDLTAANAPTNAPSPGPVPIERIGAEQTKNMDLPPNTLAMVLEKAPSKLLPQW